MFLLQALFLLITFCRSADVNGYYVNVELKIGMYTGDMHQNKPHGHGTLRFKKNDDVYKGQFDNGCIHGYGKYTWEDGSWYQGQFANDERHGQGKQRDADGTIREGKWINGHFVSSGGGCFDCVIS